MGWSEWWIRIYTFLVGADMGWLKSSVLRTAELTATILPTRLKSWFYRLGPFSELLRATLNTAAPEGLTQVQVAGGDLRGANLLLDLQVDKDLWLGTYEPEVQTTIRSFCKPGMRVFDVGANIGYTSLLMAQAVGLEGAVVAFEPHPKNINRLQANLDLNPFAAIVQVIPLAVADQTGPARFQIHVSGGMGRLVGTSVKADRFIGEIDVSQISLDEFVYSRGNPPPQLIKVDIEGGEVLAIRGMKRLLREVRPTLLLELHGLKAAQAVWTALLAAGYGMHWMKRGYPVVRSVDQLPRKSYVVARSRQAEAG
jgi:FkbM family methyltransferase